jgi:hypothetical protein
MTGFDKPPAPPTGGDPISYFLRLLVAWLAKGQIRSIQGAKQIPDANGGYHLVIPPPKYPPQLPQASSKTFYPFKIYPWGKAPTVGQTYPLVPIGGGSNVLGTCIIVAGATNLSANPSQISVSETWRFWGIRSGYVEMRSIYGYEIAARGVALPNFILANWAIPVVPKYTDFAGTENGYQWTDGNYPDEDTTTVGTPIVLGGSLNGGVVTAYLWIQLFPDTSAAALPTAAIYGYVTGLTLANAVIGNGFGTGNTIAVGLIAIGQQPVAGAPAANFAQNYIFDHAKDRFPIGASNWPGAPGNIPFTIRGWSKLDLTIGAGAASPADLGRQVFYPGDAIWYWKATSEATVLFNIYVFTGAAPAQPQTDGNGNPEPSADPNFTAWAPMNFTPMG